MPVDAQPTMYRVIRSTRAVSRNELPPCRRFASGTRTSFSEIWPFWTTLSAILCSIFSTLKPGVDLFNGNSDRDKSARRRDVSTLYEDMRRIGVIGVPPPEKGGRQIDRNSRGQFKPWQSKLRLITELPGNPLRGSPHRDEHDRKDDNDLPPENFGRGHDDRGSGVACAKSKCRIASGVRMVTVGYDSVGRGTMPSKVCYRRQPGKHLRFGSISHFGPRCGCPPKPRLCRTWMFTPHEPRE